MPNSALTEPTKLSPGTLDLGLARPGDTVTIITRACVVHLVFTSTMEVFEETIKGAAVMTNIGPWSRTSISPQNVLIPRYISVGEGIAIGNFTTDSPVVITLNGQSVYNL